MNGLDEETMAPQNFLYGCKLESGKDVIFNPDDDDFEHQLDLRMACVDASTKDELHMVEVEGQDEEGQKVKAVLVSLKPSTLPSACLGGFTISPPAVFRLKAGSGPIHISGQHLVMMGGDQSFDECDEEEEEEEEEMEVMELAKGSKKRPASSPAAKPQKKMKKETGQEDDEDDDEEDDDEDEDEEEETTPIKAKPSASKSKAATQNGKSSKPNTPAPKQIKGKAGNKGEKSPRSPNTPKKLLTIDEVKQKMTDSVKKGITLPKAQPKFENMVKNAYKMSDAKVIAELWQWRQAMKESQ